MIDEPDTCRKCGTHMPGSGWEPLCDDCVSKAEDRLGETPCSAGSDTPESDFAGQLRTIARLARERDQAIRERDAARAKAAAAEKERMNYKTLWCDALTTIDELRDRIRDMEQA